MDNKENISVDVYSKMQTGDPIAVYKKTILGKVEVSVINPFSGTPENVMLHGEPRKNHPDSFVEVWSQMEEVFFERQNAPLFKDGLLTKLKEPKKPEVKGEPTEVDYSKFDDEAIEALVTAPFMKFKKELNEIDSDVVLYQILEVAEELERPEKTMQHIRQRLAEVQTVVDVEDSVVKEL